MKPLILCLLTLFLYTQLPVQAQTVTITTPLETNLTIQNVNLGAAETELSNCTINCDSITIKNTVTALRLNGEVIFKCRKFTFEGGGNNIVQLKGPGSLTIEHSGYEENNRQFDIGNKAGLNIVRVTRPINRR